MSSNHLLFLGGGPRRKTKSKLKEEQVQKVDSAKKASAEKDSAKKDCLFVNSDLVKTQPGSPITLRESMVKRLQKSLDKKQLIQKPQVEKPQVEQPKIEIPQVKSQIVQKNYEPESDQKHIPWWLKQKFRVDIEKRAPSDPNYDPRTIHIPQDEFKKLTGLQKQYWRVKQLHMHKQIVALQVGKFYELFFEDGIVGNRVCDLNWMGDPNKMHTGFMLNSLDKFAKLFVQAGYEVVVVDQIEEDSCCSDQEDQKPSRPAPKKKELSKREVVKIITKATFQSYEWVLIIGIDMPVLLTIQGCKLSHCKEMGSAEDIDTLITTFRPVEIICCQYEHKNSGVALCLQRYDNIKITFTDTLGSSNIVSWYLKQTMQEHIEPLLEHQSYSDLQGSFLRLNQTSIEQLDLLTGFFDYLNFTVSPGSTRLLKHTICNPLLDIQEILHRQTAIKLLSQRPDVLDQFQSYFKEIPDIEQNFNLVICCRKLTLDRLEEMYKIINWIKLFKQVFATLTYVRDEWKDESELLKKLCFYEDEGGEVPSVRALIGTFDAVSQWTPQCVTGPLPNKGFDQAYDNAVSQLEKRQLELTQYLKDQKKLYFENCHQVRYFSSMRHAYEIEVPDRFKNSKPENYEMVSAKQNFTRYITPELEWLSLKLDKAQVNCRRALLPFTKGLFQQFKAIKQKVLKLVDCANQFDVLASLALVVSKAEVPMTLPTFVSHKNHLEIVDSLYPQNYDSSQLACDQIPNDIVLQKPILLTGPNMGGKSTVLRQTALNVILAQIGTFVPCTQMCLSPVDRIYTRLGGTQDELIRGASTFFCEMQEAKVMCTQATPNSLLLIDELGRGTSTYDGQALAQAVLKYLVEKMTIKKMIFSTHYHQIANQFNSGQLQFRYMKYQIKDDRELVYLYKLTNGICDKSFGTNIARIAQLPDRLIRKAESMQINNDDLEDEIEFSN